MSKHKSFKVFGVSLSWLFLFLIAVTFQANAAWNEEWPSRAKVAVSTSEIAEPVNNSLIPVRLHSGNFDFTSSNVDGSDLRVIAADDKTELKFYVEKFDALNELAIVWVQLPQLSQANKDAHFWIYSGNESAASASNPSILADVNVVAKFQFAEKTFLQDSSANKYVASGTATLQKAGLIGESANLNGAPLSIPNVSEVNSSAGYSWSAWIKPASLPQTSVIFGHGEGLSLTLEADTLHLKVGGVDVAGGQLQPAVWHHIAFTLLSDKAVLYLNGVEVASGTAALPALSGDVLLGEAYVGEVDELEIAKVVRSPAWIKLMASSQGVASKMVTVTSEGGGEEEGGEANYMGILIDSLTLDAEIVIGILAVMFLISVWVMWVKAVLVSVKRIKIIKKFLATIPKS
jgi:biopolymer transport protein ExbB